MQGSQNDDIKQTLTKIDGLSDLLEKTQEVFSQSKQKIQIYAPNLDPRILNNRQLEQILSTFIRRSRNSRLEILITDESCLQGLDHRLVKLAQNFTSYVQIRLIPKDYQENAFAFYLVDGSKMLYRSQFERYEGEQHQLPSSLIVKQSKYFNMLWQQAEVASQLRALHL